MPALNQADAIVTELKTSGFSDNDISVLFPDKRGTKDFAHEHHTKAPEGAAIGAPAGGIVGGTVGLLAGIGALAIPGLGPFIAAGPLMAARSQALRIMERLGGKDVASAGEARAPRPSP